MDSFCGISRIYFVREIFLRTLNISLKHLLTLENILITPFLFLSQKLCKAKHVNIIVGILSSFQFSYLKYPIELSEIQMHIQQGFVFLWTYY